MLHPYSAFFEELWREPDLRRTPDMDEPATPDHSESADVQRDPRPVRPRGWRRALRLTRRRAAR